MTTKKPKSVIIWWYNFILTCVIWRTVSVWIVGLALGVPGAMLGLTEGVRVGLGVGVIGAKQLSCLYDSCSKYEGTTGQPATQVSYCILQYAVALK